MKVIDLSHAISESMPFYPGTDPPVFEEACTIAKDGFAEKRITLFTHTGTHLDAPAHILPGAKTLDSLPAGLFFGEAVALDFKGHTGGKICAKDLEKHSPAVKGADFVILKTGWNRYWGRDEYFSGFPVLSPEGAEWISGLGIKGLGVDCISVDAVESAGFPVHQILLGKGIIIVENLANLDALPEKPFIFCCFPLKIAGADGSPVRAVAITG